MCSTFCFYWPVSAHDAVITATVEPWKKKKILELLPKKSFLIVFPQGMGRLLYWSSPPRRRTNKVYRPARSAVQPVYSRQGDLQRPR